MIPKGGKYAKSVVNFVHKTPQNWEKFKLAIKQIEDILKQGKLKLDGKQKTIFESNKNILKNHEKVTKKVELPPSVKKEFPPFNVSKEDPFKGWAPTLVERSNLRNIYKDKLYPPASKYTAEMEKIDEELDALAFGGEKYEGLSSAEKATIFKKLQAEMKNLIKVAKENDPTKLSLSQLNKKSQNLQKRIREIADNPNIKGTVYEGPKKDMIAAIYDSENAALTNARQVITKKNSELKYGKKYPVLDPDNDAFIVIGLDEFGHPIKMSRFTGKFSATKDKTTGELTSTEGTSFYDKWNAKTGTMRKEGEEVFHETLNKEGKVIMSNPEYKLPKTGNMEISNELYSNLSTSDLAKKGYSLKQIDMIMKGRAVRKYLEAQEAAEPNLDIYQKLYERTETSAVPEILEDLYLRGDDIYKMSMKEWVKKIPEYFAGGGQVPGFATGGISNLFRERQGFRAGTAVELVKGARWIIKMLKEIADDIVFSRGSFKTMKDPEKMKIFTETNQAIKHLESGGPIPDNLIQSLRKDPRFKDLSVNKYAADKDFVEIQEVVLGKPSKGKIYKDVEGETQGIAMGFNEAELKSLDKAMEEGMSGSKKMRELGLDPSKAQDYEVFELWEFKKTVPNVVLEKLNTLSPDDQLNVLRTVKQAFDAAQKGGLKKGVDVMEQNILETFIPKGKPHATGGLIDGYATGGVSNLFRSR